MAPLPPTGSPRALALRARLRNEQVKMWSNTFSNAAIAFAISSFIEPAVTRSQSDVHFGWFAVAGVCLILAHCVVGFIVAEN